MYAIWDYPTDIRIFARTVGKRALQNFQEVHTVMIGISRAKSG